MKRLGIYSVVAFVVLGLCACTQDLTEQCAEITHAKSAKIILSSENAVRGEILLCFEDEAVDELESEVSRNGGTRCGITRADEIMTRIGGKSIERLFPFNAASEEKTRAAGLHRWYIVSFDEAADLDAVAREFAEVSEIAVVSFNARLKHIADKKRVCRLAESEAMATRAAQNFNDPYLSWQWHYINTGDRSIYSGIRAGADVNCAEAWKLCCGDSSVVVAVVDECVQWDHPDLAANMWVNEAELNGRTGVDDDGNGYVDDIYGYNFAANGALWLSSDPNSPSDHGTHVAGTIAAVNNNGIGVCGIAGGTGNGDGVKIMSCQIFSDNTNDSGSVSATSRAIKYAADMGASIIQCSFGYTAGAISNDYLYSAYCGAEKQAIDYFIDYAHGCSAIDGGLAIFASGNDGEGLSSYPGAYHRTICVASTSCDYTPAYYTNYGPGCDISAPGGDFIQSYLDNYSSGSMVLSTVTFGAYGYAQGTSMACPHASGVAALGLSYAVKLGKHFSNDAFRSMIFGSVNDISPYCTGTKYSVTSEGYLFDIELPQYVGKMGTGLIDAYKLLLNVEGTPFFTINVGESSVVDLKVLFGDGVSNLTFISGIIDKTDSENVGLQEAYIYDNGTISLKCTRPGVIHISITYLAGDTEANGSNLGNQTFTRDFVVVARSVASNGGWL